jgi:hypothetical protein
LLCVVGVCRCRNALFVVKRQGLNSATELTHTTTNFELNFEFKVELKVGPQL